MKSWYGDSLQRLNGLFYHKDGIYFLDSRRHVFGLFNKSTSSFEFLTEEIGHGDGIIELENGDFITSSWQGQVYFIKRSDWSKSLLLDTRAESINAADIDYISESKLLLVPTFFHNTVRAYKVNL